MADDRNRILPPVFRTGIAIIDRNLDAIRETFRRLQLALESTSTISSTPWSARYYLRNTPSAPILSRYPSASIWSSGAIAITGTASTILTVSSTGDDPGVVVTPGGNHILRAVFGSGSAAKVHLEVLVASNSVAVSDWVDVADTGGVVEILALASDLHPESILETDHVTIVLQAKTVSGSGTITLLSGGANSTTLTCPWLSEVSERHYDIPVSIPVLLRNGLIPRVGMSSAVRFPENLAGSFAKIFTAPTSNGTVNIKKNGTTTVATAALTAGSTTVTLSSAGFSVAVGDWISIEPPTTDATAADLSITLKGERL